MRLERDVYTSLIQGANSEGWKLFRISDLAPGKKPFDITGASPSGLAVALEVKRLARPLSAASSIPHSLFKPHQILWLRAYAEVNALPLVAIWVPGDAAQVTVYRLTKHALEFSLPTSELSQARLAWDGDKWVGWNSPAILQNSLWR